MESQVPAQDDLAMEQLDQAVKCEFPLRTSILTNDTGDESSWGIPMVTADGEIIEEGDSPPPSALEGHAKAVSEDAKLQYIWRDTMKDYGFAGKPHRRVSVLMISWHGKLDDLETMGEVNALEDVWRNYFNYEVVKKELVEGKRPGIQLIKHLADFVFEYEGDSALLIVYYAGHGIPGPPGELHLAGKRQPNIKHSIDNAVAWHESEHIIRDAKADVLLIFDCCYAGNLLTRDVRSYYQTRSYETLAACGRREVTNPPGEDSFTSALIWALKDLLKERKRFTITELQTRIMNGAPNFPKGQFVPLLERHDPCDQRLILAPLPSGLGAESPISTPSTQTLDLRQNYLDLRFWFATRPDEEEIRNLAMRLRRDMMDKNIGARSIGWLALKNVDLVRSEKEVARNVAKHWRWVARQKSHIQPSLVNGGEGPSEPVCCPTPPGSHSSQSSVSESQPDIQSQIGKTDTSHNEVDNILAGGVVRMDLTRAKHSAHLKENRFHHTLINAVRSLYPVLKIAFVVSLSAGAWYTFSFHHFHLRKWNG